MTYFKLIIAMLVLGLVACEGTVELGEDVDMQAISSAGAAQADGKADSLGGPTGELSGAALYAQHCGSCHGADATGGPSFPKTIVGFDPIEEIVLEGDGIMPAIPMSLAEVARIQAFLLGDEGTPATPVQGEITASSDGLAVYQADCAACHGSEGEGAAAGPAIRLRDPNLMEFTVRQGRNGAGNPSAMPTYDHSAVTDAQLEEMTAWLDAFPNPTTGEGLYNQFCANCHGADGAGGPSFQPIAGQLRSEGIIRSGHGLGRYVDRTAYMPAYTAEQISDAEVVLIEEYVRGM